MLSDPLPNTLDVRRAAARGARVSGTLHLPDLPRFQAMLAGDSGIVRAELVFGRDEENRPVVALQVNARVCVTCQRCLQPMPLELAGKATLGMVWSDDQARHLPRHLDPLIVPEEGCNLWEIVEEELILLLPAYSYHETSECKQILSGYTVPASGRRGGAKAPNPFEVLAQLKPGEKPRS